MTEKRARDAARELLGLAGVVVVAIAPIVLILSVVLSWPTPVLAVAALLTAWLFVWYFVVGRRRLRRGNKAEALSMSQLAGVATRHGYEFADAFPGLVENLPVQPVRGLHPCRTLAAVRGTTRDRAFAVLRYEGNLDNLTVQGVLLVMVLPARIPYLEFRPADALDSSGPGVLDHLTFENSAFNERYRIAAYDRGDAARRYAAAVITPRLIDRLMFAEPIELRFDGGLAVVTGPLNLTPDGLESMLRTADVVADVIDSVQRYVWTDFGQPNQRYRGLDKIPGRPSRNRD